MDPSDLDAMWAQAELEERHRREDELLERHRELLREFEAEQAEFRQAFEIWARHINQENRNAKG